MSTTRVESRTTRIDCPNCAKTAEEEIRRLAGVREARVDLLNSKVVYTFDESSTDNAQLRSDIERLGHFRFVDDATSKKESMPFSRGLLWSVITAIILLGCGLILKLGLGKPGLGNWFYYAAIAAGGWDIARRAAISLRNLRLDMNFLMAIAIAGAIAIGDLHEALAVVVLFDLANLLESFSLWKLSRNLTDLSEFTSNVAILKQDGKKLEVSPESLKRGDVVVVREGMRVPTDGKVVAGSSRVDASSLTGESMPVPVAVGDEVFAGSLNQDGYLELEVISPVSESRIGQIMKLVGEASARKAAVERMVDRFARIYTPVVVTLAALLASVPPLLLGASFEEWFYKALVFLVISCPCALVISTPVAVTTALAAAARMKAIIKGGDVIERLARARIVAFDKTGTLTSGQFTLGAIVVNNSMAENEVVAIAAGLESVSNHPVAVALSKAAKRRRIDPANITELKSIPGVGVSGSYDGARYEIGGKEVLRGPQGEAEADGTLAYLVQDGKLVATFEFSEEIRAESRQTISALRKLGMEAIGVVSGDRHAIVEKTAGELELDFAYADKLPDEKFKIISELGEKRESQGVAMIGDGINDIVALSGSDLSIAIGRFGSDIPAQHSDIILFGNSIAALPQLFKLGHSTLSMIKINIAFAFAIKLLFLILAAAGYANIWMAVVADMGASLAVIFNSLRLLRTT